MELDTLPLCDLKNMLINNSQQGKVNYCLEHLPIVVVKWHFVGGKIML